MQSALAEERVDSRISEAGWPCQRLRLAVGLLGFVLFEITLGRKLPAPLTLLIFACGVAALVSAWGAIQRWKLSAQIALIMDAIDRSHPARP